MVQVRTSGLASPTNGYTGGSIREDLANYITNISRDETPFASSVGTSKATSVNHEWLTDDYANPTDNAAVEGADYNSSSIVFNNRVRKNNYTQIFRKELGVSGTSIATDQAGVANEYAYQLEKNAVELKRDIERQYVRFQATGNPTESVKNAGSASTAHRSSSIFSWVRTATTPGTVAANTFDVDNASSATQATGANVNVVSGGVSLTADANLTGDNIVRPATAITSPTAITRGHFEGLLTGMYVQGAKPDVAMMSPSLKVAVSQLFSDGNAGTVAQRRMEALQAKVGTAVTSVMTDFGFDIALMPNYQMDTAGSNLLGGGASGIVLMYESQAIKRSFLRPYEHTRLDNGGDGLRGLLICEETLEVRNPKAVGALYGVR